jgi:hypothetical protein
MAKMRDEHGEIVELIIPMYEDAVSTFDLEISVGEVVRCKDCKYYDTLDCFWKIETGCNKDDDWYCADGVKRDG